MSDSATPPPTRRQGHSRLVGRPLDENGKIELTVQRESPTPDPIAAIRQPKEQIEAEERAAKTFATPAGASEPPQQKNEDALARVDTTDDLTDSRTASTD